MNRISASSVLRTAAALCGLLGSAACSVPLAPGYRILKQSREVQFIAGRPAEVRVATNYTLENSGTADLPFIDINLPAEKPYGRKDLRVKSGNGEVSLAQLPEEYRISQPNMLRIVIEPLWRRREIRDLEVRYTFRSPENFGERITIGPENFHLGSRGWPPLPQPPRHALSPYPSRPRQVRYSVRVPSNFLVLARGTLVGRKKAGGQTTYWFELRKDDLTAFVVAGHYLTTPTELGRSSSATFWTFEPLKEDPAPAIERITAAWKILEKDFGPLERNLYGPHIVETTGLTEHLEQAPGPSAAAFPGGALVDAEALALGINSEDFIERVTHALAHNWFGDEVFFAPYAALGMGEGLPEYATIIVDEDQNGETGRRRRVLQYLNDYEEATKGAEETPLGTMMIAEPPAQRRIGLAKAPLFFTAIEDFCGKEPTRVGLRQMVTLLRGQETGYDALRSALEQSCGKNLAEIFRVWLNVKGIPPDFRARYAR